MTGGTTKNNRVLLTRLPTVMACPDHLQPHCAAKGGPDRPGHDLRATIFYTNYTLLPPPLDDDGVKSGICPLLV